MPEQHLPEGWREAELGSLGICFRGRGGTRADEDANGLPCIRYGDLYTHHHCIVRSFCSAISPARTAAYTPLQSGDIVFAGSGETSDEIGKAAAYCGDGRAYAGGDTVIFRPRSELDSRFTGYAVNSISANRHKSRMGQGSSVFHISPEQVSRLRLRFPSNICEQQRIADVLLTIDDTIERTEALIAKTQQIRTGLMHDLFTRGVTPDGELRPPREEVPTMYKESPFGWIPKEWNVSTVGECLSSIDAGHSPECPDTPARGDQWGVLKVGAVDPDGFREEENKTVLDSRLHNSSLLVHAGDLLLSRANTVDLVGVVCHVSVSPRNLMLSDKTLRLRPIPSRVQDRFLFWSLQLRSLRQQIENAASGTSGSMKNISQKSVRTLQVALPDLEEQSRLVARIDASATTSNALNQEMVKLRLLKAGLMHDLLTGRVRVSMAKMLRVAVNV